LDADYECFYFVDSCRGSLYQQLSNVPKRRYPDKLMLDTCPFPVRFFGIGRLNIQSPSEQVVAHLREQLLSGEIEGRMPGTPLLSERLGVDRKPIIARSICSGRRACSRRSE